MIGVEERVDRLEDSVAQLVETVDQIIREMREDRARTDAFMAETGRRAEKAWEQAEQDRARMDAFMAETGRRAEKAWEQAEKDRKEFNKRMAELSDSMGTLVEDMVAPSAGTIAAVLFGEDPVITTLQRVRRRHPVHGGWNLEIDLMVIGQSNVMVVEAKRKITPETIAGFLARIQELKGFFPEYATHRWIPVVASVSLEPSVIGFLNHQRVYGVAMGDDTFELVNAGQF